MSDIHKPGTPSPENCPEPFWHETHMYCPCCTWVQPTAHVEPAPPIPEGCVGITDPRIVQDGCHNCETDPCPKPEIHAATEQRPCREWTRAPKDDGVSDERLADLVAIALREPSEPIEGEHLHPEIVSGNKLLRERHCEWQLAVDALTELDARLRASRGMLETCLEDIVLLREVARCVRVLRIEAKGDGFSVDAFTHLYDALDAWDTNPADDEVSRAEHHA